jgi:ribosome biogenesis protein MAK21
MFRPGLSDRARYYCVVALNQLALSHRDKYGGPDLARKLIDLYFTLFRWAA